MRLADENPNDELTGAPLTRAVTLGFALTKTCAICAGLFTVKRKTTKHRNQKCCSRRCGAIWRVRQYPQFHTMQAANKKRRDDLLEQRRLQFGRLTKEQCYRLGRQDGYSVGYQRRAGESRA